MATPRFNLRNASLYLTKLKNKYQKPQHQQENVYDNTFIDEEDQLISNPSLQKLSSKQIHSDRFESDLPQEIKDPEPEPEPEHEPSLSPQATQTIQHPDKQSQQTQFCDLIIIKYLEETLAIYKGDLQILQHNRENLEQQIYFIGKKIGKFHQMVAQNAAMEIQIQKINQTLKQMILEYHQSKKKLFLKKISLTKIFQKYQNKLKQYLLYDKKIHSENDFYLKPDCLTSSYIDEYAAFLNFKQQQSAQISSTLKNPEIYQKSHKTLVKKLFQGKEQIYLPEPKDKIPQLNKSVSMNEQLQDSEKKKEKKVVLYDEYPNDEEEFGLKPKDNKGKKMTEAQKNSLLGDLKNFSKSFKIPK